MSSMFDERKKGNQNDYRDLAELFFTKSDNVVIDHIKKVIEYLQQCTRFATLNHYKEFLIKELKWIEDEERLRARN